MRAQEKKNGAHENNARSVLLIVLSFFIIMRTRPAGASGKPALENIKIIFKS